VLGAGGQLGSDLVRLLPGAVAMTREELSVTDAAGLRGALERHRPEVVFNCAAYNFVDRAESEPDLAFAVNAQGALHVARSCRRQGATLVHFSTNFVFDGAHDQPYVEADEPAPLSVYSRSKLEGERLALQAGGHVLIVRTAAVFGGPQSFPQRILERARSGEKLRVVSDQRVNPTFARDLAAAALEMADHGMAGIVHAVAEGCASWDEFARCVLAEGAIEMEVESIPTGAYPAAARRPLNGCLASTRFKALRPWQNALHEALNP